MSASPLKSGHAQRQGASLFKQRVAYLYEARFEALGRRQIVMSQPIVVTLPHQLGKEEAVRRLRASFSNAQSGGAGLFVFKNQWSGDHLDFRASMLGQNTTGTIDVAEDHVRLQVQLPWLLSLLANKAKALVEKQGKLMLEKPVKPSTTRS
jgi:hypothetical protein